VPSSSSAAGGAAASGGGGGGSGGNEMVDAGEPGCWTPPDGSSTLHVCVVGSGPAGFYVVDKLLKRIKGVHVDILVSDSWLIDLVGMKAHVVSVPCWENTGILKMLLCVKNQEWEVWCGAGKASVAFWTGEVWSGT